MCYCYSRVFLGDPVEIKRPSSLLFTGLLVRPFITSTLICLLWYGMFVCGVHIPESDESTFTDTVVPTLAMFHALFGAQVVNKALEEYQLVKQCIRKNKRAQFKDCMQDRMSRAVLLLLFVLSVLVQGSLLAVHWDSVIAGLLANFCVAFALTLVWEVATNLDNPRKAIWYINIIPKEWMEDVPE